MSTAPATRQRTLDPSNLVKLCAYLTFALGADRVEITSAELLTGGAVQENWAITADVSGGARAGTQRWVLRTDAAARIAISLDRSSEFRVVKAAHAGGIRVAEPIAECADASIIGAPFTIQAFATGKAQARAITRDPALAVSGPLLARDLGVELAKIHAITPGSPVAEALSFLPLPMLPPARIEVERLRAMLDGAGEARPALEYILRWLETHAPASRAPRLVHGDFRTGNYLVDGGKLSAVLDWEFAHWGDPAEDIGWFCARCWRFGNDALEAGGIAQLGDFLDGYRSVAPLPCEAAEITYWEIMAAAKWATVAVLQGDRYRKGGEDSLEVVLTGLMAPEMELDALLQIESYGKALAP